MGAHPLRSIRRESSAAYRRLRRRRERCSDDLGHPDVPRHSAVAHRPRPVHAHPHAIENREHPGIRTVQSAIVGTDPGNARRVRPLHLDGVLGA